MTEQVVNPILLADFLAHYDLMRKYQIAYFANRMSADKQKAIQYEQICDKERKELTEKPQAIQEKLL